MKTNLKPTSSNFLPTELGLTSIRKHRNAASRDSSLTIKKRSSKSSDKWFGRKSETWSRRSVWRSFNLMKTKINLCENSRTTKRSRIIIINRQRSKSPNHQTKNQRSKRRSQKNRKRSRRLKRKSQWLRRRSKRLTKRKWELNLSTRKKKKNKGRRKDSRRRPRRKRPDKKNSKSRTYWRRKKRRMASKLKTWRMKEILNSPFSEPSKSRLTRNSPPTIYSLKKSRSSSSTKNPKSSRSKRPSFLSRMRNKKNLLRRNPSLKKSRASPKKRSTRLFWIIFPRSNQDSRNSIGQ